MWTLPFVWHRQSLLRLPFRNGKPTSLRADIGTRLLATGYVVAAVASLADFIGVGAQQMPNITFGPVQVIGLVTGVILSLIGVIFYWPRRKTTRDSNEVFEETEDQPL